MKNLYDTISYMLYAYSVKEPIGGLNLKRALDEDTGVFSSFFSLLSSSSPLGQCTIYSIFNANMSSYAKSSCYKLTLNSKQMQLII